MKLITLLLLTFVLNACESCNSITIAYEEDDLKRESANWKFTNVHQDSLLLNFDSGFHELKVYIEIENERKTIRKTMNQVLGTTGHLVFKRPVSNSQIKIEFNNSVTRFNYNRKFNTIHLSREDCQLTVRHTNRMIYYD